VAQADEQVGRRDPDGIERRLERAEGGEEPGPVPAELAPERHGEQAAVSVARAGVSCGSPIMLSEQVRSPAARAARKASSTCASETRLPRTCARSHSLPDSTPIDTSSQPARASSPSSSGRAVSARAFTEKGRPIRAGQSRPSSRTQAGSRVKTSSSKWNRRTR
jgi:hypothetical protein